MVCPDCYGTGAVGRGGVICAECQGSGIISCCDTAGANGEERFEFKMKHNPFERLAEIAKEVGEDGWQDWVNSQLAGTTRKDETALYARIVELEKRVVELEHKQSL